MDEWPLKVALRGVERPREGVVNAYARPREMVVNGDACLREIWVNGYALSREGTLREDERPLQDCDSILHTQSIRKNN